MNILYTASEALPFIASGGLADVAGSLPAAINAEGHDCRVVIPYYSSIRQELKDKLTYVTNFTVPVAWRNQYCGVFTGVVNGVTYYLLDNEYYFQRNHTQYSVSGTIWLRTYQRYYGHSALSYGSAFI